MACLRCRAAGEPAGWAAAGAEHRRAGQLQGQSAGVCSERSEAQRAFATPSSTPHCTCRPLAPPPPPPPPPPPRHSAWGRWFLRRHGDEVERLSGGAYRALGRVDDTMNLGGIKVSSGKRGARGLGLCPDLEMCCAACGGAGNSRHCPLPPGPRLTATHGHVQYPCGR